MQKKQVHCIIVIPLFPKGRDFINGIINNNYMLIIKIIETSLKISYIPTSRKVTVIKNNYVDML